ncbi:MAG: RHS repeat-associated core domain-containing protein [Candidatus Dormiibacterota bacterium]
MPSGATYHYSQDDLGSTRVLTDSSGAVADTDTYDPYGNVTASTGTVQDNLLYCGQYMDTESGLYYLQARYYDPANGQFTSVDPLVAETLLPYAYTAGDPVNTSDASGDASGQCSWLSCVGQVINTVSEATGVCLRNPFGGNNNNGGCHTELSTAQARTDIGITLTVGAVATGVGGLVAGATDAAVLESSAGALEASSITYGVGGGILDGLGCKSGSALACDAAVLDGLGLASGLGGALLPAGSVFALGFAAFSANIGFGALSVELLEALFGDQRCNQ